MSKETDQPGQSRGTVSFRETELKICSLCGWLNLDANAECFVCGWHGHFEHDPDMIRAAFDLATRRYGRLELQHLTDLRTYRRPSPPTLRSRVRAWLCRLWSWMRG